MARRPADHLREIHRNNNFTLFAGSHMQQTWSALYWFEAMIRQLKPKGILSLGTLRGALECYFGLIRPDRVITCDIEDQRPRRIRALHERLGVRFVQGDLSKVPTAKRLMRTVKRPALILCDDGDKLAEFMMFVPLLKAGDVIAVHDNPQEFKADGPDAQKIAVYHKLQRWRRDALDADRTRLAVWVK